MADATNKTTIENKFIVNVSPHFRSDITIQRIMLDVIIALIPALIASIYFFGIRALFVTIVAVISCVLVEYISNKFFKKKENTILDLSAVVTGILLAFTLPVSTPYWVIFIGSFIAIFVAKQVFGGLGHNIFNPALIGRAFLLSSWPVYMTTWHKPLNAIIDANTCATPLGILKEKGLEIFSNQVSITDLFIGNISGSLGETSALAILLGAIYLFIRKHITWHIPITYILTVAVLGFIFGGNKLFDLKMIPIHIFSGGLFLGAFFMATDMVTSPTTKLGRILFGFGCGVLVILIRKWGAYPEGVCYSIIIMNCFTPLLDKFTKSRVFGEVNND